MSQVITQESWFDRLGGSIKGVVAGLVLFAVSFPLLFVNEGRAVKTAKALEEGANLVVEAASDSIDPANEGRFVHTSDLASTDAVLKDDFFGVSVNAIRLNRRVEMLQWKEKQEQQTRKKIGGGTETVTTYSYVQEWSPELINSTRFHEASSHVNPTDVPFQQLTVEAPDVFVGSYRLPKALVQQITVSEPLEVSLDAVQKEWAEGLRPYSDGGTASNGFYWSRSSNGGEGSQIGDVRILFTVTRPLEVSIMAQQTRDTFTPFIASNGRQLNMLTVGVASADQMFATAAAQNSMWTWILRAIGAGCMFFGLTLVVRPLSVLADVLPPVGSLVEMGTGFVALLVSASLSLATISVAWLFYRPLVGIPLLLVGMGLIALLVVKLAKQPSVTGDDGDQRIVARRSNNDQTSQSFDRSIGV
ncbi:MAG: TMEM43 family protein [Planctomycetales bacterium]|nr:TMEM43 family protein [Planctomycetales bacterium]